MALRIERMALFSSRDTCACEMPICPATSICVRPPSKRRARMRFSRYESPATASRSVIDSIHCSSVFFRSRTWSMTVSASPPSE